MTRAEDAKIMHIYKIMHYEIITDKLVSEDEYHISLILGSGALRKDFANSLTIRLFDRLVSLTDL